MQFSHRADMNSPKFEAKESLLSYGPGRMR
jgi:hypothetical protein